MRIRVACFALLFLFTGVSAHAQTPTPGGGRQTIQSLSDELAALKARVAKLESGKVEAADLAGTYWIQALGVELHGGFPAQIGSETSVGTMTLNADGSGVFTGKDARWDLRQGAPWSLTHSESTGSGTFTWIVEDGKVVIPEDEDGFAALIAAGGKVLIGGGTSDTGGWSNIFLMFRLPNE